MCGVVIVCAHVETDADRNRAAEPVTGLVVPWDIAREPGHRHSLDGHILRAAAAKPRPVIVYLYGGSWSAGAQAQFVWVGAALARWGFVAVVPERRICRQTRWPMFLQDNTAALRWVRDQAAQFGGDLSEASMLASSAR